jgi:hypothetical protein
MDGCDKIAKFGVPGYALSKCWSHRTPDMVKQPRKRCIHPKCNELAMWGLPGQMVACEAHKSDGHVNLVEKPCV